MLLPYERLKMLINIYDILYIIIFLKNAVGKRVEV